MENQNQMDVAKPQPQQKAVATQPINALKSMLSAPSVQAQFNNALGNHKDAFVASLIDLYTGDKSLQTCKPQAVIAEALRAATLQLPLNKALGFAYIIVFNNKVKITEYDANGKPSDKWVKVPTPTFIPGYKGYIQLAMRTGQYRTINADVVYEGEMRKVDKLSGEVRFDGEKKSDKVVGYFCYFQLLNGFSKTLYMSVEEMASYAKRYSPGLSSDTKVETLAALANAGVVNKKAVGWTGNFNDMGIKTVIRRLLSKYGYLSVEMQDAISKDVDAENSAMEARDEAIADGANKKMLNLGTAEVVDTETGEIIEGAKAEAAPKPDF